MVEESKTVFISYRRRVASYIARAIYQDLREHGYDVFMDVESIDSGTFDTIILNQIAARAHFCVILTPGTMEGIEQPGDWLRREIERAIALERNVVPIVANGFSFETTQSQLTGRLSKLPRYNALTVHHDYFEAAMARLRTRFLKQPVDGAIAPTPNADRATVRRKVEQADRQPMPTQRQLSASDYAERGFAYHNRNQYELAIDDYDRAIALDPSYALAYSRRGAAYSATKQYDRAIADCDRAILLDPDLAKAYNNRGLAYYETGQYEHAMIDYDRAIALAPSFARAFNNRGIALDRRKQYGRAIADFDQAIALDPSVATVYINRGITFGRQERYERAIFDFDRAIALDPHNAAAYYGRGTIYYAQGQFEHAIADYDRAIALAPNFVQAYTSRSAVYRRLGRAERADADARRAQELMET